MSHRVSGEASGFGQVAADSIEKRAFAMALIGMGKARQGRVHGLGQGSKLQWGPQMPGTQDEAGRGIAPPAAQAGESRESSG